MKSNEFTQNYFIQNDFLTEKDKEKLLEMAQIITFPINKIILHRGEENYKVGVVMKGLIRAYDKNNKTVWIFSENNLYGSLEVITQKAPSAHTHETLEETTMILFNYYELEKAIKEYPNIAIMLLSSWKSAIIEVYTHFYSLLHLSPEKRYLHLLHQNSKLILRVKSKDLATYLGIHPVSLSRLKKRYFTPKS